MRRCACGVLAIVAAACGRSAADPAPDRAAPPEAEGPTCEPLRFAATTPVPEASGAAWLEIDGKARLVVVGDSGNHGAYGLVDPESGETVETGRLPLGAASDDIEGAASRGGRLYGLTSSGWIRVWERKAGGFALVGAPYPIGPVDLPDGKNQSRPPAGGGMVCGAMAGNCGRNYEGLCLAPAPAPAPAPRGGCVGFAASKADGHLYCLTDEHGALAVHRDRAIAITRPGALADCAFSDDGTLWAASNLFDLGNVYRVARWDDPAAATVERIAALVVGFPEVIAVRGDIVYRMSDLNGAPSLMGKYRCRR